MLQNTFRHRRRRVISSGFESLEERRLLIADLPTLHNALYPEAEEVDIDDTDIGTSDAESSGLARVQVVHNSPYAIASEVDVYINDSLAIDNCAFRQATEFIDFPVGATVAIAGRDSTSSADPIFEDTPPVTEGGTFVVMAIGDPSVNSIDPDAPDAFRLSYGIGREAGATADDVDLLVFHGSPDAPPVDVRARGVGNPLVSDIAFGEFDDDGYFGVAPDTYALDITPAGVPDQVVISFEANLQGTGTAAAIVAASGFLTGPDPGFGLLAVFPNGTSALLPVLITGSDRGERIQVEPAADDPNGWHIATGNQEYLVSSTATDQVIVDAAGGRDSLNIQLPPSGEALPSLEFRGGSSRNTATVFGTRGDDHIVVSGDGANLAVEGNLASATFSSVHLAVFSGRNGDDVIDASGVEDLNLRIYCGSGHDLLRGGSGNDAISGGSGNDAILGGDGWDRLFGQSGHDLLAGNAGSDFLSGGSGNDLLLGGSGFDFLDGGRGRDLLAGGPGFDIQIRGIGIDHLIGTAEDPGEILVRLLGRWTTHASVDELIDHIFQE